MLSTFQSLCLQTEFIFFRVRPKMVVNRKLKEFTDDCPKNPVNFVFVRLLFYSRQKSNESNIFAVSFYSFVRKIRFSLSGSTKNHWNREKTRNVKGNENIVFLLNIFTNFNLSLFHVALDTSTRMPFTKYYGNHFFGFKSTKNWGLKSYSPTIFNSFSSDEHLIL